MFVWRERRIFLSLAFPAILFLSFLSIPQSWLSVLACPSESIEFSESSVSAEIIVQSIPGRYQGSFCWKGNEERQSVTIAIHDKSIDSNGLVAITGENRYDFSSASMKATIDPGTMKLEMWEFNANNPGFITDGQFVGGLSNMTELSALWIGSDGNRGTLNLKAKATGWVTTVHDVEYHSAQLVFWLINLSIWVMFSVAWHRKFLIPDQTGTVLQAIRWGQRQTRFFLIALALTALSIGILFVVGPIVGFLGFGPARGFGAWFAILVMVGLVYVRLSLLFPAAAVDHRMSLGECWDFTQGNGRRILLVIGLVWIPVVLAMVVIGFSLLIGFSGTESPIAEFGFALVTESLNFVGIALGVSSLSIAYRYLMDQAKAR